MTTAAVKRRPWDWVETRIKANTQRDADLAAFGYAEARKRARTGEFGQVWGPCFGAASAYGPSLLYWVVLLPGSMERLQRVQGTPEDHDSMGVYWYDELISAE